MAFAPVPCPQCGKKMYDNSADKRSPRSPDYRCTDGKNCGGKVWLKDGEKNAIQGQAAATGQAKRPPLILDKLYGACIDAATELGRSRFKDGEVAGLAEDLTLKIAGDIFRARTEGRGILLAEKKALMDQAAKAAEERKKAEELEAKRREEEARRKAAEPQSEPEDPAGWYSSDQDDDLPF